MGYTNRAVTDDDETGEQPLRNKMNRHCDTAIVIINVDSGTMIMTEPLTQCDMSL